MELEKALLSCLGTCLPTFDKGPCGTSYLPCSTGA